ncbi:RNA polymerase sigma-70 factor (ECF subfamily) [Pullulanibacillus pueri]|uniref:RNA polymerase sigma factor n=1 Tax=Pullulanibacillus pueri TaxID=1437324 RepID=A0A8J2ZVB4_9BACL|nr:sigma-70 family RNA polymerase sigma factor [Pullulanibacillus pueri]MBM7681633.1 RNA polymerase sigma-70 factor (ECF subfamily) [Pullulanibacillus pueri]GGH79374.1 RNA polymerase subunit sigma [Pullulanibacillus pueri]
MSRGLDETPESMDNEQLLENLMVQYGGAIKKLAYTYVRNWSIAEDITQEVFLSVYKNLHRFRGEASYKTWLYKIAINKSKDALKTRYLRPDKLLKKLKTHEQRHEQSAEEVAMIKDEDKALGERVMALPLKYREVIILYYYEGLKLEEIELYTQLKLSTIKTRLRRARGLLRKMYEEKGGKDIG